jgi:hypothetical protein
MPPATPPSSDHKKPNPHGPVITKAMFDKADWPKILDIPPNSRPKRSTRNPAPVYKDSATEISAIISAIDFTQPPPSVRPWSATMEDIANLNHQINVRGA